MWTPTRHPFLPGRAENGAGGAEGHSARGTARESPRPPHGDAAAAPARGSSRRKAPVLSRLATATGSPARRSSHETLRDAVSDALGSSGLAPGPGPVSEARPDSRPWLTRGNTQETHPRGKARRQARLRPVHDGRTVPVNATQAGHRHRPSRGPCPPRAFAGGGQEPDPTREAGPLSRTPEGPPSRRLHFLCWGQERPLGPSPSPTAASTLFVPSVGGN